MGPQSRLLVSEELLDGRDRSRLVEGDDAAFYGEPRFVHHVDSGFRTRLTELYRAELRDGDRVLDLMGSWVSHLPEAWHGTVVGHGLNGEELAANDRYDDTLVRNLNTDPTLPFEEASFDAVLCAVSVQYLQYPGRVFGEVARVLRPGGVCIVSFSNRMFVQKAVRAWRERDMAERSALVREYLDAVGAFDAPTVYEETPDTDPFRAVVARRR